MKRYSYHFIEHGFIEVDGLLMGGTSPTMLQNTSKTSSKEGTM
jgi:hypothetical protein